MLLNKDYIETINGVSFKMIFVKGGKVTLEYDGQKTELTVPNFHLAETPVTQELWREVMGKDPERLAFKGHGKRPVERASWLDIVQGNIGTKEPAFLTKLNSFDNLKNKGYKLPLEAMWQFAAQGGNKSNGYQYAGSNHLIEVGWYTRNSHGETKPVKLKFPNELGFYDMSGNIWEWCQDKWMTNLEKMPKNGLPNEGGDDYERFIRVLRGGSWLNDGFGCRVSVRHRNDSIGQYYGIGFRLSRF